MKALAPVQTTSAPSSFTGSNFFLQRKCACGGSGGLSGTCEDCADRQLLRQPLQAKLVVGSADDPLEREADRVAEQVMRMPEPERTQSSASLSDGPSRLHKPLVQPRSSIAHGGTQEAPNAVHDVLRSSGQPLGAAERQFFEPRFGHDFSQVRVHSNAIAAESARAIHARAYTVGHSIAFAEGEYSPGTSEGKRLLAHELMHVMQQDGRNTSKSSLTAREIRRQPATTLSQGDGLHGLARRDRASATETSGGESEGSVVPSTEAQLTTAVGADRGRVQRIVMSCRDMRLRVETAMARHLYRMETCAIPLGSYETRVTVTGSDFELDFGSAVGEHERFEFSYSVESGQENPADFLRDQASVHVDVVEHVPPARTARHEALEEPRCVVRLDDRELVPSDSLARNLFEQLSFERTLWAHPIPLGQFGWVEVEATASGSLTGRIAASYGPGRLTDICLTFLRDREASAAPIDHPLLGRGSRTDVTTYHLGGRARFRLPARATIRIAGAGRLRVAGDYLSVIELAAAEGALDAAADATLSGSIDAAVEIAATATHAEATLEDPLLPIDVILSSSTVDSVDLAAEIGLRAKAALAFRVGASAAFDLAGFNIWSQRWDLPHFSTGITWSGGLKYSPNPGLHWDLGTLGMDDAEAEGEDVFHEDATEVDVDSVVDALFDETQAQVTAPEGLDEDDALPFDWYKPLELYPVTLDLPNADEPQSVERDDGPVTVRYTRGSRTLYEEIGVADWPSIGRTFQFIPYDARSTPEQARFNRILDALGYDRSGLDAEHVWDVYLLGLDYDRFDNLWPASNQEQQLAGTRHRNQIRAYEARLGNVAGRWFRLTRVRHPA